MKRISIARWNLNKSVIRKITTKVMIKDINRVAVR